MKNPFFPIFNGLGGMHEAVWETATHLCLAAYAGNLPLVSYNLEYD